MNLQTNATSRQEEKASPNYTKMLEERKYDDVRRMLAQGLISKGDLMSIVNGLIVKNLGTPRARELIAEFGDIPYRNGS